MQKKILFVDDEPQILAALEFSVGQKFNIVTALEAGAGFRAIQEQGPFAVIVSDLHMPEMDGVRFLEAVKERSPDSVRLMLTSKADLESAIQVVNQANIFRFLTKPCPTDMMVKCLYDALQQYHLVMAEREVLEKTLRGAIRAMTEILSMIDPESFDRAVALQDNVRTLATALGLNDIWQLEVAALLAPIGCVTIPTNVINKARARMKLADVEQNLFKRVPEIGKKILMNIPRLEMVSQIVHYQDKHFDGSGFPADKVAAENIPIGARILKVLVDLAELKRSEPTMEKAFQVMRERDGFYDRHILEAAFTCFIANPQNIAAPAKYSYPVRLSELCLGQVLLAGIETLDGTLLISAGREVTEPVLEKITNFAELGGIKEPILVESLTPAGQF